MLTSTCRNTRKAITELASSIKWNGQYDVELPQVLPMNLTRVIISNIGNGRILISNDVMNRLGELTRLQHLDIGYSYFKNISLLTVRS